MVSLYYYEELTLREIGEVLGVTESRVSQLHTKAILRLRVRLQGSLDHAASTAVRRCRGRRALARFVRARAANRRPLPGARYHRRTP